MTKTVEAGNIQTVVDMTGIDLQREDTLKTEEPVIPQKGDMAKTEDKKDRAHLIKGITVKTDIQKKETDHSQGIDMKKETIQLKEEKLRTENTPEIGHSRLRETEARHQNLEESVFTVKGPIIS